MPDIESSMSTSEEAVTFKDSSSRRERLKFSSTFSTYLTLLGNSLGISDIWRFPFLAYRNGGGAFLIPFVIMLFVCGVPIYFLEYSVSKFSGKGPYQLWDICPLLRGVGITVSLLYFTYLCGATVFRGCWLIDFLVFTFRDPIPYTTCTNDWNTATCRGLVTATNTSNHLNVTPDEYLFVNSSAATTPTRMSPVEEFWQFQTLKLSTGIGDFSPFIWKYVLYMAVVRIIVFLASVKSIKSIEKVIYVTATFPMIATVALFIRSLLLPGAKQGIYYFFYPQFSKLLTARVWIEATLMVFYTLSFGWGSTLLLGSHADFKDNCLRTTTICAILDGVVAAFNGLVCFSVLGNMAHSYDIPVTEVINAGMSTGIVSYVTALTSLSLPQLWASLFLISLFMTSLETSMIPLDMIVQLIGDLFPRLRSGSRIPTLIVVSLAMFLLSLPTCTGAGAYIFMLVDWYPGSWAAPIVVLIEIIVVAWIYGLDRFSEDVKLMIGRSIPAVLRLALAFVSPILVLVLFFTSCVKYMPPNYGSYQYPPVARLIGWAMVAIVLLPILVRGSTLLYGTTGNLKTRFIALIDPLENWCPCSEDTQVDYHAMIAKYRKRTFKDLFYFNVFGAYPTGSLMNQNVKHEIAWLKKNENNA